MSSAGFIGKNTTTLDTKGRCSFPRDLRKSLPESSAKTVVITIGSERSLSLYPLSEWKKFMEELSHRPRRPENVRFRRQIMGMAKESTLDGQNRVSLTEEQRKYAGIKGEVTFAGDGAIVGLWNPDRYQALYELSDDKALSEFDSLFYWDEEESK